MDAAFTAPSHVNPEAMQAAAAHVAREYGYTGYTIGVALAQYRVVVFEVRHSDGSAFNIVAGMTAAAPNCSVSTPI